MAFQSFEAKLNPNNLYPTMPGGHDNDYSLFQKFLQMQGNGIRRLAPEGNMMPMQRQQTREDFNGAGPLRPGYTPPGMNVQYRAPMSDQIADQMLGVGPGAVTPEIAAANKLKSRAIDASEADKNIKNDLAQQKVDISSRRADVYDFKAKNPGSKFQVNKTNGHLEAINPVTNEVTDLGTHQLDERQLLDLNQNNKMSLLETQGKQRESLAELQARQAKELADHKASLNTGTNRTETVTDASGKTVGSRTTTTKPNPSTAAPKIGDIKTFPNGRKGRFDGKGYVPVQ